MLKKVCLAIGSMALLSAIAAPVNAAILSVGEGGKIIDAPASVFDDAEKDNEFMLGFNEKQNILLTEALEVDGGFIEAGKRISSHMIFLNTQGNKRLEKTSVSWLFDGTILGVMSDNKGNLEKASNELLGAEGTQYPGSFKNRGFETNNPDEYKIVDPNTLEVTMLVTEPGDWIRVITEAEAVPEPASMLGLLAVGAVGFGAARKRQKPAA